VKASAFPPSGLTGDLAVAAVAASLENLAVFAYTAGLTAATQGKLGTVPPAVATFATTVKGQHQQHAAAWNAVLQSHGKAPVTVTNPTLTPTVQADFAKVTDIAGLAQLAVTLETIAAQTYQVETSKLKSSAAIQLSSSIQPVEMQHIAILYYVLGMYPGAQTSSARRWRSTRRPRPSEPCGNRHDGTGVVRWSWSWRARCSWPRAVVEVRARPEPVRRRRRRRRAWRLDRVVPRRPPSPSPTSCSRP